MSKFDLAFDDAKNHARKCFPEESCGIIVDCEYVPLVNEADDIEKHRPDNVNCTCKLCSFRINPDQYAKYATEQEIQYVVHSHPNGPFEPSLADMEGQVQTGVPWAIIPLDDERSFQPIEWGHEDYIPPLIGRSFIHGVTDCYSLVRDTFRLGKDKLLEQGIEDWPFDPVVLDEFPREGDWWYKNADLYSDNFKAQGFVEIPFADAKPGDCFILKIRSEKYNHAGVLVNDGLIIHHLPQRLSRREPAGIWGRQSALWVRYVGRQKEDNDA